MHLIVFGANGPTGRLVVQQALAAGHQVAAVTRKPDEYPLASPHLAVVAADVTDTMAVQQVLADRFDAVISTYGVPYSRSEITVYSRGIANIALAMTRSGIRRLVCVSSTTVARDEAAGETLLWRKAISPVLRHVVGRTLYDDMERMEQAVRASGLDWTIVRPAGLFDATEPTDDYEVSSRRLVGRVTSRADLAETLIAEATGAQHLRTTIEVITRSATPSPATFLREVLGGR